MALHETMDASLVAPILDLLPDAIIWVQPVIGTEGDVADFEVIYSNKTADDGINHPKGSLTGLRILGDGVPGREAAEANFGHLREVYESGEVKEYTFYAPHSNRQYETVRRPYQGGVLSTTRDRRAQREAERKEEEKTQLLNAIVNHAPAGIEVYEAVRNKDGEILDFRIKLCNHIVHQLSGIPADDRNRLSFRELLQTLGAEANFQRYVHTVETGEPFSIEFFLKRIHKWINLSVVKLGDGFLIILADITEAKKAALAQQKQSQHLRQILDASLNAVMTLEAIRDDSGAIIDLRYTQINEMYKHMIGKGEEEVIGKTMLELFPTAKASGAFDTHCQVIQTGVPARFDVRYQGEGLDAWYDIASVKLGDNGAVVTFADVLEQKRAAAEIEHQKNLLDNILKHSSNGISVGEVIRDNTGRIIDFRTAITNDAACQITGIPKELYLSKSGSELDPSFTGSPYFQQCVKCMETGEPFIAQYFLENNNRWLEVSVSKMDQEHQIYIFTDVTTIKEAQLATERSAAQLQTIINRALSGIFTITPIKNTDGEITDFRFVIVNRALAAYLNQEPEKLIGQPGSRWFTGYKSNGLFSLFCDTYQTCKPNRFEFHYQANGIDAWIDMMCTRFNEELLVTFTDFTSIKKLQLELQKTVEELKHSNESLEEFAYAASHDLQEPLRKIHTFSDRLRNELATNLNSVQTMMFERIENATQRMRHLIDDLLAYAQVSRRHSEFTEVDLSSVMEAVLQDLEASIQEKSASIIVGKMPVISGDERQMRQLFQNLIGNAVKYHKPDVPPVVNVSCQESTHEDTGQPYYQIEITDNGIGFDPEYAETIFQVFQRLHGRSEYEGTGIGLAIVHRVVQNHNGFVAAEGKPGEGATFRVLLPV